MSTALKINEKLKVLHSSLSGLKTKALEDGSVYFEGWANKAIVDRGRDLISKKEWKLDNYKKNSIVLFNHDHSQPVGKMIAIEPREEGLYVKGRISNSKDKSISRVRDLVGEGILNSLSVGIRVGDETKDADGNNILKNVELHEVSIVAVPMNQDSQFSIAAKALAVPVYGALTAVAEAAGHEDVVAVLKQLAKINESLVTTDSLDYVAENLSTVSGIEKAEALDFIRLKQNATPAKVADWLIKVQVGEGKSIDEVAVHAINIPKDKAPSKEEAIALAEGTDWATDNVVDGESVWTLIQQAADQFDGELRSIDLGNGLVALLGTLKASEEAPAEEEIPKTEDETVVMEEPMPPEDGSKKGLLDEQGLAIPAPEMDASKIEVNPYLDQARQTNILLANLVSLMQQVLSRMDMMQVQESNEPAEVAEPTPPVPEPAGKSQEEDEGEVLKMLQDFMVKTQARLDSL